MTIEERVTYAAAKIRNLIYYRLTIEESLWETRFKCQYIHELRKLRETLVNLCKDLGNDQRALWFQGVIDLIDPKIKSNECLSTIRDIEEYVKQRT